MDLKVYLESTIPDNIKSIDLVKKCTDVFAEMLMANSSIAFKINNLFDVDKTGWDRRDSNGNYNEVSFYERDSDGNYKYAHILKARENLKKGLFYTYLSVMFNLLEIVCSNPEVIKKLKERNFVDSKLNDNPYSIVNSEYLGAFRYFQQSSGTEQAIRYIYQFSRYLETGTADNSLELDKGDPFYLEYRGELHKSIFSDFNHPMAHPCGWCFRYDTIIKLIFQDYYGIKINYNLKYVIAYKSSRRIYFGRPPLGLSANVCQPEDIENFEEYFNDAKTLVVPLTIKSIDDINILFENHSLYEDRYLYFDRFQFPNGWHLMNIDKSQITIEIEYKDEFLMEDTLELGKEKKTFYYIDNFKNAFKLVGDSYPFIPGVDESKHKVTNNCNVLSKFELSIPYRIQNLTYLSLEDDYGHKFARVLSSGNELKIRTHDFYGEYLTFKAMDGLHYNYDHYLRTNLLNNHNSSLKLSGFSIKDRKLKFNVQTTMNSMIISITINNIPRSQSYGNTASIDIDTSSYPQYCDFKINVTDYNDTIEISGNGLNNANDNFYFGFPQYPTGNLVSPRYSNCTPDTMNGLASGTKLEILNECSGMIKNTNGVIYDDPTLVTPQKTMKISDLNPQNHSGICYINKGYEKVSSETSECLNSSCTKYATDEFQIGSSGYDTFLTFDNPEIDSSIGKYLVCRFNNDPQESVVRGLLIGHTLLFTSTI